MFWSEALFASKFIAKDAKYARNAKEGRKMVKSDMGQFSPFTMSSRHLATPSRSDLGDLGVLGASR
jgi:hypothetical protein